jgi:hypothetical protein
VGALSIISKDNELCNEFKTAVCCMFSFLFLVAAIRKTVHTSNLMREDLEK